MQRARALRDDDRNLLGNLSRARLVGGERAAAGALRAAQRVARVGGTPGRELRATDVVEQLVAARAGVVRVGDRARRQDLEYVLTLAGGRERGARVREQLVARRVAVAARARDEPLVERARLAEPPQPVRELRLKQG